MHFLSFSSAFGGSWRYGGISVALLALTIKHPSWPVEHLWWVLHSSWQHVPGLGRCFVNCFVLFCCVFVLRLELNKGRQNGGVVLEKTASSEGKGLRLLNAQRLLDCKTLENSFGQLTYARTTSCLLVSTRRFDAFFWGLYHHLHLVIVIASSLLDPACGCNLQCCLFATWGCLK